MKRACIFLGLSLALCTATPCWAMDTAAQDEAIGKLPEDLNTMLESTWYCQGVTGEMPYVQAKDMTLSVLGKLTDTPTAEAFVATIEKKLEAGCPRSALSTCWADYLEMDVNDREGGKRDCQAEQDLASAVLLMTLKTIVGTPAA